MATARHGRTWWQAQVLALEASGEPHKAFAERRGLKLASLRHWLYSERSARRQAELPAVVEVLWQSPVSVSEVVVEVGPVRVQCSSGVEAAWLAEVVGRLARSVSAC